MTAAAVAAEGIAVRVLQAMAARAVLGSLEFHARISALRVAALAADFRVRTEERKRGPRAVIESPRRPGVRVVTGFARRAEAPFVAVLCGVASDATQLRALIGGARVTFLAGGDRVRTE